MEVDSRVGQCGTEVFPDVGFKDRVKVLELSVCYEPNDKNLSRTVNKNNFNLTSRNRTNNRTRKDHFLQIDRCNRPQDKPVIVSSEGIAKFQRGLLFWMDTGTPYRTQKSPSVLFTRAFLRQDHPV